MSGGVQKGKKLSNKVLIAVFLFGLILTSVFTAHNYFKSRNNLMHSIDSELTAGAYAVKFAFGESFHNNITPESVSEDQHKNNIRLLNELTQKIDLEYLYSMVLKDGKLYITSSSATDEELKNDDYSKFFDEYPEFSEGIRKAIDTMQPQFEETEDSFGYFRSIIIPFKTSDGQVYIVGADREIDSIKSELNQILLTNSLMGLVVFIITYFLITRFLAVIFYPITRITESAIKISKGDLSADLSVTSNDETKLLSEALTNMVTSLKSSCDELKYEKSHIEEKVKNAIAEIDQREKYLSEKIRLILGEMEKFANGNLTVKLSDEKDEHIGRLYRGFNQTAQNTKEMLVSVLNAVEHTMSNVSQISHSTDEMNSGKHQENHQLEEINKAVQHITHTIKSTTEKAQSASLKTISASENALKGSSVIEETIMGMEKFAVLVNNIAGTVKELGKGTDHISEILQVIDEIADQTNLLALNAAIEAARAGEQGRGFAVVADEVRKLAERTSKATKEIASMLQKIQKDTDDAINIIDSGNSEVEKSRQLSNTAAMSVKSIIDTSKETVKIVDELVSATEEEASAITQIARNISTISQLVTNSNHEALKISESIEDLYQVIQKLHKEVNKFKLN